MKRVFALLCAIGMAASADGGTFAPESPPPLRIVWAVPTNVWPPDKIWSYKVVPQQFSAAVLSNLTAIGSFTAKDKLKLYEELLGIDTNALFFGVPGQKSLEILPTLGYIKYHDESARARFTSAVKDTPEPVAGVPDEQEAVRLGLQYLRLLGINRDDIARKPSSPDLDIHWSLGTRDWVDPQTKQDIRETNSYGVFFTRQIDGIAGSGFGDVFINFGDHARVCDLEVSWRNLQPDALLGNFVTSEQVVQSIRSGQTRLPKFEDLPLSQIKTLTITNATPRYSRMPGDEPMAFVVPALQLGAFIDDGKTNRSIWFQTGILSADNK
jgi:hypothetical protein